MEIKKTKRADLERQRWKRFLLGLVISVVAFLAVLEIRLSPADDSIDEALLDELAEDMELMPLPEQHDMEAAAQPVDAPKPEARIRPVDTPKAQDMPERLVAEQPAVTVGEGEPLDDDTPPPAVAPVAVDENDKVLSLRVVERLPEFPGGMVALMKWLTQNLKYPPAAQKAHMQGEVTVSFIINTDGTTSDPKIIRSAGAHFDSEALRVVRMMPRWQPGEDHGKPCRTMFAIPIVFKL